MPPNLCLLSVQPSNRYEAAAVEAVCFKIKNIENILNCIVLFDSL